MASKVTDLFKGYHVEDPPIAKALFASTGAACTGAFAENGLAQGLFPVFVSTA